MPLNVIFELIDPSVPTGMVASVPGIDEVDTFKTVFAGPVPVIVM